MTFQFWILSHLDYWNGYQTSSRRNDIRKPSEVITRSFSSASLEPLAYGYCWTIYGLNTAQLFFKLINLSNCQLFSNSTYIWISSSDNLFSVQSFLGILIPSGNSSLFYMFSLYHNMFFWSLNGIWNWITSELKWGNYHENLESSRIFKIRHVPIKP